MRNLPKAGSQGLIQCMCESMASSTFEVYCLICSSGASGLERLSAQGSRVTLSNQYSRIYVPFELSSPRWSIRHIRHTASPQMRRRIRRPARRRHAGPRVLHAAAVTMLRPCVCWLVAQPAVGDPARIRVWRGGRDVDGRVRHCGLSSCVVVSGVRVPRCSLLLCLASA